MLKYGINAPVWSTASTLFQNPSFRGALVGDVVLFQTPGEAESSPESLNDARCLDALGVSGPNKRVMPEDVVWKWVHLMIIP
jgi:hypothetical protein